MSLLWNINSLLVSDLENAFRRVCGLILEIPLVEGFYVVDAEQRVNFYQQRIVSECFKVKDKTYQQ